jgi:very-short-patch-repair endonuclease
MNTRVIERNMFYGAKGDTFEAAKILRKNMTLPEVLLWKKLNDKTLFDCKFRRQHPANIFILDFYCHELKLAIEIDGEIHDSEEIKDYDVGRSAELGKFGINIIRFSNDQILFEINMVVQNIQSKVKELAPFRGLGGINTEL